jgi:hypothetical protein
MEETKTLDFSALIPELEKYKGDSTPLATALATMMKLPNAGTNQTLLHFLDALFDYYVSGNDDAKLNSSKLLPILLKYLPKIILPANSKAIELLAKGTRLNIKEKKSYFGQLQDALKNLAKDKTPNPLLKLIKLALLKENETHREAMFNAIVAHASLDTQNAASLAVFHSNILSCPARYHRMFRALPMTLPKGVHTFSLAPQPTIDVLFADFSGESQVAAVLKEYGNRDTPFAIVSTTIAKLIADTKVDQDHITWCECAVLDHFLNPAFLQTDKFNTSAMIGSIILAHQCLLTEEEQQECKAAVELAEKAHNLKKATKSFDKYNAFTHEQREIFLDIIYTVFKNHLAKKGITLDTDGPFAQIFATVMNEKTNAARRKALLTAWSNNLVLQSNPAHLAAFIESAAKCTHSEDRGLLLRICPNNDARSNLQDAFNVTPKEKAGTGKLLGKFGLQKTVVEAAPVSVAPVSATSVQPAAVVAQTPEFTEFQSAETAPLAQETIQKTADDDSSVDSLADLILNPASSDDDEEESSHESHGPRSPGRN